MGNNVQPASSNCSSASSAMTPFSRKLKVSTVEDMISVFDTYGACIVDTDCCQQDLDLVERWMFDNLAIARSSGDGRWSLTNNTNRMLPVFQPLLESQAIAFWIRSLIAYSLAGWMGPHRDFLVTRVGGDMVERFVESFQGLHSDDNGYDLNSMSRGISMCVSVAPRLIHPAFAPIRLIPWNVMTKQPYPDGLHDAKLQHDWYVTMQAGEMLIRDSRVCHSGTPNLTENWRCLPGFQVLTPQYQEYYASWDAYYASWDAQ